MSTFLRFAQFVSAVGLLGQIACSSQDPTPSPEGTGGATGGSISTAGSGGATGGVAAVGGASSGGASSGGSGGALTGGTGGTVATCSGTCADECATPGEGSCDGGQVCCVDGTGAGPSVSATAYQYAATVENTGVDCVVGELPDPGTLPSNSNLPDPFVSLDGTKIDKTSQWRCRRQEIHEQAEAYVYGEKPEPELVMGSVSQNQVAVHVEALGSSIDFTAEIVLPSVGQAPYPAIINVGSKGGFGGISLGESRILDEGVAVIYYNHNQIGQEGPVEASRGLDNPGLFYDIYGGDHSAGLLMAWAWGASRLIDVLQESGEFIDVGRLGVTGCSRNGKGAFTIGVFDERIALTIPHETSTGGVPAYRIVDVLNTERTDHNYFGLNWLSNNFEPFVFSNNTSNAVKLPIDAHSMVAMIAPRALLVLDNPHQTQMSAPAGYVSTMAGKEVFDALGIGNNVSYVSNVAETPHCSYKTEYTEPLLANIRKFLKREGEAPGVIDVTPQGTLDLADWQDWQAPTLEDDAGYSLP